MDRISGLPDESLIKILSFLPTKDAVSTSLLSKRWEFLWMWLPKLEYDDAIHSVPQRKMLRCFLHRSLPLHKSPVIQSLRLKFHHASYKPEDFKLWIVIAASRCVRELDITNFSRLEIPLPSSLYTSKFLVVLKLRGGFLLEVPRNVILPCLKKLQLHAVTYMDEESFHRILSISPLLEELFLDLKRFRFKMEKLAIIFTSLKRLTLSMPYDSDIKGFVINTPSLEHFKLVDRKRDYYVIEDMHMPKLVEAYIYVFYPDIKNLIGSITSVKHLTLSLGSSNLENLHGYGFVFNQLKYLKLRLRISHAAYSLIWMLQDSPNLLGLDLSGSIVDMGFIKRLKEPTMAVPECVSSRLQIFKWSRYSGSPAEIDLAVYILENARRLKTATISSSEYEVPKLEMIKELALSSRASSKCQLIFN